MQILISGASIAGPVLAHWLRRYGFAVTVVERAPGLRKTGGHAVDLFKPAMEVVERMGVQAEVVARRTGTERMIWSRPGRRPMEIEVGRLMRAFSDRHVEIMRDDLSEIFVEATKHDVEYLYGDSIAALSEDAGGVTVRFEHAGTRRYDLVIGADGLHSNVRRLVFGEEAGYSHYIGAHLAVVTVPNYPGLTDEALVYAGVGRLAGLYSAQHSDAARAVFLWRCPPLGIHHRDVAGQKAALRAAFADVGWEVPRIFAELERTPAFYFDAITQLRMDTWTRGRVGLVGDAGYSPGPAVGGSTSLAVVGAYVLAGELAAAGGDHVRGFKNYEAAMIDYVRRSRVFALQAARHLVPASRLALGLQSLVLWLLGRAPQRVARAIAGLGETGVHVHDTFALRHYTALAPAVAEADVTTGGP
jgi:2-polyprenyl-6-methoxyphenol hydroxylase-like FAD-dependent oxidoreductase